MIEKDSKFIVHHSLFTIILGGGLLLTGLGGGFLPWIWQPPVALQLTAPGLAEFVKFLPQVRTLQVEIERLYFLWPLFQAMLALPLFAATQSLPIPGWLRWLMRLAVIPLGLAALSPVWTPAILIAPEFRVQTGLAVLAWGLLLIQPLLRWLPGWLLIVMLMASSVAAAVLPRGQFMLAQAGLTEAYNQPVTLGWGWLVMLVGLLLSVAGGLGALWERHRHG